MGCRNSSLVVVYKQHVGSTCLRRHAVFDLYVPDTIMKLQQSQVWKQGETFFRIVRLERLEVEYKSMTSPNTKKGTHHHASKKEFCRLIKGATLLTEEEVLSAPPR